MAEMQRKRKHDPEAIRQALLRQNLNSGSLRCLFCGGGAVATEPDHIPARALFRSRQWPEGYSFPSCAPCNRGSKDDERRLAFLIRLTSIEDDSTPADREEWKNHLNGMRHYDGGLLAQMRVPISEGRRRNFLQKAGVDIGYAPVPLLPILPLPNGMATSVRAYLAKLAKALHYLHTGVVVPDHAHIAVHFQTNAGLVEHKFPLEISELVQTWQPTIRATTSLDDQFSYRYSRTDAGDGSAFLCKLRTSIVGSMLVICDGRLQDDDGPVPAVAGKAVYAATAVA